APASGARAMPTTPNAAKARTTTTAAPRKRQPDCPRSRPASPTPPPFRGSRPSTGTAAEVTPTAHLRLIVGNRGSHPGPSLSYPTGQCSTGSPFMGKPGGLARRAIARLFDRRQGPVVGVELVEVFGDPVPG